MRFCRSRCTLKTISTMRRQTFSIAAMIRLSSSSSGNPGGWTLDFGGADFGGEASGHPMDAVWQRAAAQLLLRAALSPCRRAISTGASVRRARAGCHPLVRRRYRYLSARRRAMGPRRDGVNRASPSGDDGCAIATDPATTKPPAIMAGRQPTHLNSFRRQLLPTQNTTIVRRTATGAQTVCCRRKTHRNSRHTTAGPKSAIERHWTVADIGFLDSTRLGQYGPRGL
jgi:hypothetical protein